MCECVCVCVCACVRAQARVSCVDVWMRAFACDFCREEKEMLRDDSTFAASSLLPPDAQRHVRANGTARTGLRSHSPQVTPHLSLSIYVSILCDYVRQLSHIHTYVLHTC